MAATEANVAVRKNSGLSRQLFAVILISIGMINCGMMQGWMSPMSSILKSSKSPVGPLDSSEFGFLASLSPYAALIGGLIFGYIADSKGRKAALSLSGMPSLVGGILLTVATTKLELYIGRCLTGFSAMVIFVGPMYLSECVHDSIRGTLISFITLPSYVGILLSYTLVEYLSYKSFNCLMIAFPAIYVCTTFFLPETPYYLLSKSRVKNALRSLAWFRGGDFELANVELKKIQCIKKAEKLSFSQSFQTRQAKTALIIGLVLYAIQTLSGIHVIINYASTIFTETGSLLSPDGSAIFIALTIIVATLICLPLIDKIGRKPVLYFSCITGFICHTILTVSSLLIAKGYDVKNVEIISFVCISAYIFSYGVGMSVVPSIIVNEVSSVEIKPYIGSITATVSLVFLIALLQEFPVVTDSVGIYVNFAIPAVANFVGIIFTWYRVPETKGKSLNEIADYFKERGT